MIPVHPNFWKCSVRVCRWTLTNKGNWRGWVSSRSAKGGEREGAVLATETFTLNSEGARTRMQAFMNPYEETHRWSKLTSCEQSSNDHTWRNPETPTGRQELWVIHPGHKNCRLNKPQLKKQYRQISTGTLVEMSGYVQSSFPRSTINWVHFGPFSTKA